MTLRWFASLLTLPCLLALADVAAAHDQDPPPLPVQAPPLPGPLLLQLPSSARTAALAGAWVAGRDHDVIFHNPAQLVGNVRPGVDLSLIRYGPASTSKSLASSVALGKWSLTLGWGVQLIDLAPEATAYPRKVDVLLRDASSTSTSALMAVGGAVQIKGFRAGITGKYVSELEQHALLADIGVARNQLGGVLALSVQNLGGGSADDEEANADIPTQFSYGYSIAKAVKALDVGLYTQMMHRRGSALPAAGVEVGYSWIEGYIVSVRAGVRRPERGSTTPGDARRRDHRRSGERRVRGAVLRGRPRRQWGNGSMEITRSAGACRTLMILAAGAVVATGCSQALTLMEDDSATVLSRQTITAPNPADRGSFTVKQLFYGSGTDKQRREYREDATIKTKTVDVSPFATIQPPQVRTRRNFFGFDLKQAPINGRVWYPDGAGPFPLVLIVHGNHNYREFSDPGYDYLGALLASRGFIMSSVDENFINGLSGENDARAWLLLKHLEARKEFNTTEGGPFHHRVDMTRIAVMGHSRGGEAAAHAATFNRLKYYPDNFKQQFNFNFDIKAVVAIAPVDGQYKPTGVFTPLENVNYLLIHGSHDGDVSTAIGLRQYERLRFTDGQPWFKSTIFMYRANHEQWNTVWGNKDNGPRSGRRLDLRALVDGDAQREFGKVVISGFLEATLNGKREYLPMFRDHRTAGRWLPKTMYTTRFQERGYRALAEFDNDIDITTGTAPGVVLAGEHLSTWHEKTVPFRGGTETQDHNAVWLGWNNELAGDEKEKKKGPPASYSISVPDALRSAWRVNGDSAVYLSLAAETTKPGPRSLKKEGEEDKDEAARKAAAKKAPAPRRPATEKPKEEKPDLTPIDLTIELADGNGRVARLPLSRFGIPRKPLETRIFRRADRDKQRFTNIYELIPQTFVMPVADFVAASPDFDPSRLASITLRFDRTDAGTVVIEHVGLSTPSERAFLAAPIR